MTLILIALAAAAMITGCSTTQDSNPAAPGTEEIGTDMGDRDGLFTQVKFKYNPFDCTCLVTWVTSVPTTDNYFHYGTSASSLPFVEQAPDGGTVHTVTIDCTNVDLTWFYRMEGVVAANFPPVFSEVDYARRRPCLLE